METKYLKVNCKHPEPELIKIAAQLILNQELVAFPTETVYGLGALAWSPAAVHKIFAAKQRPANNPLLVHVSNRNQVNDLVTSLPPVAQRLMDQFWPGPLSIILPASSGVPAVVRGGKSSVGLRMPSHPVALALLEQTGPVAAPSANLSGHPSPVTADHVRADLNGRIAAILDAGATGGGVESTVLDLSREPFTVLRRGGVGIEALEAVLGQKVAISETTRPHFQTDIQIVISRDYEDLAAVINNFLNESTGVVYYNFSKRYNNNHIKREYELDLNGRENSLYGILRDAEQEGLKVLVFAPLPQKLEGVAASIADRIQKAAAESLQVRQEKTKDV
ncbi:MAG: L-threonylcarbamoyladenylate synthase [Syntrophomonadaceae bacterium]|jgi:L-threonylcarbamoyladenylate synthase